MRLSRMSTGITKSPTFAVEAKAAAMRAQGIDVIPFGAGEPDFDTPEHIREEAKASIDSGHTRYTPTAGTAELRQAIADSILARHGLAYKPSNIIVSCGAKHSLFNAFLALVDPGDEVIVPAPYWVSYPDQVRIAGGTPVIVDTSSTGFKLTAEVLEAAITPHTRVLILNSPSNPTGASYTRAELEAIADVVVRHDLVVISDEIYDRLLYTGEDYVSIAALGGEVRERTLIVNGVAKTYAMTGWRLGWAAGNAELVDAMNRIQSHSTSNPCSVSQRAALAALRGPDVPVQAMVDAFRERGERMWERLNRIPYVSCPKPTGAFYCFPNVGRYVGIEFEGRLIESSYHLADVILEHAHVAVVAGAAFGCDGFIRLSYATSIDRIEDGMDRIERLFATMLK